MLYQGRVSIIDSNGKTRLEFAPSEANGIGQSVISPPTMLESPYLNRIEPLDVPSQPGLSGSNTTGSWNSSADGGFLLYPNRPNNNGVSSAYKK